MAEPIALRSRSGEIDDPERLRQKLALESSVKPALHPEYDTAPKHGIASVFHRFQNQLVLYNLEARGIHRVEAHERHDLKSLGYSQIGFLWFSVNLAANNITLGMLAPVVFGLSFTDASLTTVFGVIVGCLPVAYIATFGPRYVTRRLVLFFGADRRPWQIRKQVACRCSILHGLLASQTRCHPQPHCMSGLCHD